MYSEQVVELFEKFSPTLDLAGAVALVSCVKSKLRKAAPARELYSRSPWFRTARKIVEASSVRWFLLSAKHGLIAPDRVTAPYDATLKDIGRAGRQGWPVGCSRTCCRHSKVNGASSYSPVVNTVSS